MQKQVKVIRRGDKVDELFNSGGELEVKGDFAEVTNLRLAGGRGLSLVSEQFPPAPFHVNLRGYKRLPALGKGKIYLQGSKLVLAGQEIIDLQRGVIWPGGVKNHFETGVNRRILKGRLGLMVDLAMKLFRDENRLLELSAQNFKLWLCEEKTIFAGGRELMPEFSGRKTEREPGFEFELRYILEHLADFFAGEGQEVGVIELLPLVGAGKGLTPAGDDLLVGFLSALYFADSQLLQSLPAFLLSDFEDRTTFVSSLALRAALQGSFSWHIINLYRNLKDGTGEDLLSALEKLNSVGSTSGLDMLAGIFFGLYLVVSGEDRFN